MRFALSVLLAMLGCILSARTAPVPPHILGPPGRVQLREYTQEDGLPSSAFWGITQDPSGLIWFFTENGPISYDGRLFRRYGVEDGLPQALTTAGTTDAEGHLWVVGKTGLAQLQGSRFIPEPAFEGRVLRALFPWTAGRVLVVDQDNRFFEGPTRSGFRLLAVPEGEAPTALFANEDGDLWVSRGQVLMQRLRDGTWKTWGRREGLRFTATEDPKVPAGRILQMVQDRQGSLWARSTRHLFRLSKGADHWEDLGSEIPPSLVVSMCIGLEDRLWVLTDQGLYLRTRGHWHRFGRQEGLASIPRLFFEDREGSLWLLGGTLRRLMGRGAWSAYQEADGLPDDLVWSLHRDAQGQLLVGTYRSVVQSTNGKPWQLVPGLTEVLVNAWCETAQGNLYAMSSYPTVLYARARGQSTFRPVPIRPREGLGDFFHALIQDRQGRFWLASEETGLWKGRLERGEMIFTRVDPSPSKSVEWIADVVEDEQGRIWAGGSEGLILVEGDKARRFTHAEGLPTEGLGSLVVEPDGHFWGSGMFGPVLIEGTYRDGHLRVDRTRRKAEGLGDALIYTVLRQQDGVLWLLTGAGIDRLEGDRITHFGRGEGLVGEDTMANRALLDPTGDLWVATSNGLARFQRDLWGPAPEPPWVRFASMRLGETDVLHREGIEVPYANRRLDCRFSAVTFLNEKSVHLQTRILGFVDEWQDTDEGRLRVDQLPAGRYQVEVQARIASGAWGPIQRFSFRILPPWWGTWWFRSLVVLASLGSLAGLASWWTRTLRRRALRLEAVIQERTSELAKVVEELREANEALHNLSLSDPLTGLRNRRYLMQILADEIARVLRSHQDHERDPVRYPEAESLFVFMVDLDHFKRINDTYGHSVGDSVLVQLRDVLLTCVRTADKVVRWGGEEFLLMGSTLHRAEAANLADRIRAAVEAHGFMTPAGQAVPVTCSIGWSLFPFLPAHAKAVPWERVQDVADQALYAAKHSGRNAWVGVMAAAGAQPDVLEEDRTLDLADLASRGLIHVQVGGVPEGQFHW